MRRLSGSVGEERREREREREREAWTHVGVKRGVVRDPVPGRCIGNLRSINLDLSARSGYGAAGIKKYIAVRQG